MRSGSSARTRSRRQRRRGDRGRGANVVRGSNIIPGTPGSGTILAVQRRLRQRQRDHRAKVSISTSASASTWAMPASSRWTCNGRICSRSSATDWTAPARVRRHPRQLRRHQLHRHAGGQGQLRRHLGHRPVQREQRRQLPRQHREHRIRGGDGLRQPLRRWHSRAPNGCGSPSFYTIDLSARWKPTDAFEIFASVQNVTDKIAPLDPLTYGARQLQPDGLQRRHRPLLHGGGEVHLQLSGDKQARARQGPRYVRGLCFLWVRAA